MTTATASTVATGVGGPVEASRIAWRRARSFNPLSGNRSWLGVLLAPWVWPVELLNVATSASRVRRLGGASMTLHDGRPTRPDPGALALAVAVLLAFMTAVVTAALPLAETLPIGDPALAAIVALGVLCGPLLAHLGYSIVKLIRVPELRTLNSRRNELSTQTGRPVLVMASFARSGRPGEGRELLDQLRTEWAVSSTTVILNPANRALADYYIDNGAELDAEAWRRLRIPPCAWGGHRRQPVAMPNPDSPATGWRLSPGSPPPSDGSMRQLSAARAYRAERSAAPEQRLQEFRVREHQRVPDVP